MQRVKAIICGLLLLATAQWAWANELIVKLDRPQIAADETVNLFVQLRGASLQTSPDFSGIKKNFTIYATQQSSEYRMVNGKKKVSTLWILALSPKHSGQLTIPSLSIDGVSSKPVTVTVASPNSQVNSNTVRTVFVKSSFGPADPYQQQQANYIVKVYSDGSLVGGVLTNPQSDNAMIARIGADKTYQTTSKGKLYDVIERHYAIFPQKSGTITIKPAILDGQIANSVDPNSPLAQLVASSTHPIHLSAQEAVFHVKAPPAHAQSQWWLPAANVSLKQTWSTDPRAFQVGKPITRTITLTGKGLTGQQLPQIKIPTVPHTNTYPSQPTVTNEHKGLWVEGSRIEKIVYVPTMPGSMTIPALQVSWWNTQTNKPAMASLPAEQYRIAASANDASAAPAQPVTQALVQPQPKPQAKVRNWRNYWPYISGVLLLAWLTTMFLYWRKDTAKTKKATQVQEDHSLKAIKKAAIANDREETHKAILAWAANQWPGEEPRNLMAIAELMDDGELTTALIKLDRALYNHLTENWQGESFWPAFEAALKQQASQAKDAKEPLPPLYPEE